MLELVLAIIVVGGVVLAVNPARRRSARPGYSAEERRRIERCRIRLAEEPGSMEPMLELFEIHRSRGDRGAVEQLLADTASSCSTDPRVAPIREFALFGFTVDAGPTSPSSPGPVVRIDPRTDNPHLHLGRMLVTEFLELHHGEIEVVRISPSQDQGKGGDKLFRVLELEASVSEVRLAPLVKRLTEKVSGLAVTVKFSEGEIGVAGSFFRVPFNVALTVVPTSDRVILVSLPRAGSVLGLSLIPPTKVVEKLVEKIGARYPGAVDRRSDTSFAVDVTAIPPVPVEPNLEEVRFGNGEIGILCRERARRREPAIRPVAPVAVAGGAREEMRLARQSGNRRVAQMLGERLLGLDPSDLQLRQELVDLAFELGDPVKALDVARAAGDPLPVNLRFRAGRALIQLGRKLEATTHFTGLAAALSNDAAGLGLAADLLAVAELSIRQLGLLDEGEIALSRLLEERRTWSSAPALPIEAAQLAWEAGKPALCERLARVLVSEQPLEARAYRYLGLGLQAMSRPGPAHAALTVAAWLSPDEKEWLAQLDALRHQLAPPTAAASSDTLDGLIHPDDRTAAGSVLSCLAPELDWLFSVAAPPPEPDGVGVRATRATHPTLVALTAELGELFGHPIPEMVVESRPEVSVQLTGTSAPQLRLTEGLLADLGRQELAFVLGRSIWLAGRGVVRYLLMDRSHLTALVSVVKMLKERVDRANRPFRRRLMDRVLELCRGSGATPRQESLLAELLTGPTLRRAATVAASLPDASIAVAELERWILAQHFSADRAGLLASRDVGAALSALLLTELASRPAVNEIRERGLPHGIRFFGSPTLQRRIAELISWSVSTESPEPRGA
ncbi:MAG: hypothetical protein HY815_00785 [Candidatus Riflebacteria bacterium]|nr:hypothetical protein [Candidatus Riflebacteria bacterium]